MIPVPRTDRRTTCPPPPQISAPPAPPSCPAAAVYLLDIVAEPLEGLLALGLLGPVLEDEGKAKTVRGGQQVRGTGGV